MPRAFITGTIMGRYTLLAPLLISLCGCGGEESSYFPLQAGHSWEYRVRERLVQIERTSRLLVVDLGSRSVDGEPVHVRQINEGQLELLKDDEEGVRRIAVLQQEGTESSRTQGESLLLARPWTVGTQWQQTTVTGVLQTTVDPFRRLFRIEEPIEMTYTIELLDDYVKTPAGLFTGCLRVRGKGQGFFDGDKTVRGGTIRVEHLDWYAPGVGLVKSDRYEATDSTVLPGGRYTLELVRFD